MTTLVQEQYVSSLLKGTRITYTESKVTEGHHKLVTALGQTLNFDTKSLEACLELVSKLSFYLLGSQVVTIRHVLVFSKICSYLSNLKQTQNDYIRKDNKKQI